MKEMLTTLVDKIENIKKHFDERNINNTSA